MESLHQFLNDKFIVASFDMDGTLIKGTTSNLFFAKLLNVENEVIELEKKLYNGDIGSDFFMIAISEIMESLTVSYVEQNFHLLPIVDDIHETVNLFKKLGIIPILVTTSNIIFAECFKKKYGFDYVFGTIHEVLPDGRIGIGKTVCSSNHKIQHVKEIVEMLSGSMSQVIAIGDSFSDIPLFSKVGCSIAFNYDDALKDKANVYVKSNSIFSIFDGIKAKYKLE